MVVILTPIILMVVGIPGIPGCHLLKQPACQIFDDWPSGQVLGNVLLTENAKKSVESPYRKMQKKN